MQRKPLRIYIIVTLVNMTIVKLITLAMVVNIALCKSRYYGSVTSYEESLKLWNGKTEYQIQGCIPQLFVMYARHATRNPSVKYINRMDTLLLPLQELVLRNIKEGKSQLNGKLLKKWEQPFTKSTEQQLVQVGKDEMYNIGKNYQKHFPDLLKNNYSCEYYDFVHTTKSRTKDTAKSWSKAIFGDHFEDDIMKVNNTLLRFYKKCKKWKEEIDDAEVSLVEERRFAKSKVFKQLINNINKKLGLTKTSEKLSKEILDTLFQNCRYQYATDKNRFSPWCEAINEDNAEILEYLDDLDHYWKDSYGFELNYQQACEPLKDLMDNIRLSVSGDGKRKGVFRFTHQGFMQKFYARLGLFKDPRPLTSSWWSSSAFVSTCANSSTTSNNLHDDTTFDSDVDRRKYRLSKICPFAANIVFVLYNCTDQYKVKTFVQEHQVQLPDCSNVLCDLDEFQEAYQDIVESCDIRSLCNYNYP